MNGGINVHRMKRIEEIVLVIVFKVNKVNILNVSVWVSDVRVLQMCQYPFNLQVIALPNAVGDGIRAQRWCKWQQREQ